MSSEKIDLAKLYKAEYKALAKPIRVEVESGLYLSVEGSGPPGADDYVTAITALYGMAYTIKMGRKADGQGDYVISKLEAIYWQADGDELDPERKEDWSWRLMIRTPREIAGYPLTDDDLEKARKRLRSKKKDAGSERVSLTELAEGPCVQMLHVGPYEKEQETIAVMREYCAAENLEPHGRHHEIYLSDPRRVAPEKLKTILRMRVR